MAELMNTGCIRMKPMAMSDCRPMLWLQVLTERIISQQEFPAVIHIVVTASYRHRDWRVARRVVGNVVAVDVGQLPVDHQVAVEAMWRIQE